MTRWGRSLLPLLALVLGGSTVAAQGRPPRLLIRSDDLGFSHAANEANRRVLAAGRVVSTSVLFVGPWWREAVEILRAHPEVAVGVHLSANSEWKNYRWGPAADRAAVPGLVDREGVFWGSYRELNVEHPPRVEELETEFRAQIERALRSGLRIAYLDNHMGAGLATPEQRAMVQRLAREYRLPLSGYAGETRTTSFYGGDTAAQLRRLLSSVATMKPDSVYLAVFHLGVDSPELRALEDLNEGGVRDVSRQRQTELDLLLSPRLTEALKARGVRLVTYRDLVPG